MRFAKLTLLILLLTLPAVAQIIEHPPLRQGAVVPATCNPAGGSAYSKWFFLTVAPIGWVECTAINTWTRPGSTVVLGGDLSGTPGAASVDKLKGKTVTWNTPAAGHVVAFSGANDITNQLLGLTSESTADNPYVLVEGDRNKLKVITASGGAVTVTDSLSADWVAVVKCTGALGCDVNRQTAGTFTGCPTGSTTTCHLKQYDSMRISTGGVNSYQLEKVLASVAPADLPSLGPPAAGTSVTLSTSGYYKCSGACNVTLAATAGNQYCVRNDNNVSSAITLVNVSGVQFEATAHTSYYAANRKLVSGGAVTDAICIVVNNDATKFDVWSSTGTWTDTAP